MTKEINIEDLMIYPIKSISGIGIDTATLTTKGLRSNNFLDHEFMIVRSSEEEGYHNFLTQRDKRDEKDTSQGLAILSTIKPSFVGSSIELKCNNDIVCIDQSFKGKELPVKIWKRYEKAIDQGEEIAEFLSDYLKLNVRLVKAIGENINFQDRFPIHYITKESIEELCGFSEEKISWKSFRPQIVLKGMAANYEHRIYSGKINNIPFVNKEPCSRCPVTLVDQDKGKVRGKEPLRSLFEYKKWKDHKGRTKVIFGEYMVPFEEGEISRGDKLIISKYRNRSLKYF